MKIAIFGASGFLGTRLMDIFSKKNEVIGADTNPSDRIEKVNALNSEEVESFLKKHSPELVIDTIGLASSFKAEQNPLLAKELNYTTAKNISNACKDLGAVFVFISSSYIFDGKKGDYIEEDDPSPTNIYGKTKVMAEKEILKYENSIILRTTVMYGYNGRGKGNGILNSLLEDNEISLREPYQIRQPLWIEDVPEIIKLLIKKHERGIFHMAGPEQIKMLSLINVLKKASDSKSSLKIIVKGKKPLEIPHNDTLDCSKLEDLGMKFTSLKEGLKLLRKQIKKN